MKLPDRATRRPGVHLSDLEHVVLLATPARCFGRAGHVELLLLLGNVSQDRTQALVLDNRGLVDLLRSVGGHHRARKRNRMLRRNNFMLQHAILTSIAGDHLGIGLR